MDRRRDTQHDMARGAMILLVATVIALVIVAGRLGSQRFMTPPPTPTPVPTATPLPPTPLPTSTPQPELPTPTPLPQAPTPTPVPVPVAGVDELYAQDGRNIVCLDPGHGGEDLGNVRLENGQIALMEKDFTLEHAQMLAARLRADGFEVVLTRETDSEVNPANEDVNGDGITADPDGPARSDQLDDLQARVNICNIASADLLVSVHYNGAENEFLQGYEVWYNGDRPFSGRSEEFASLMHQSLAEAYAAAGYEANDRGIGLEDHAVTGPERPGKLIPSDMPGAVIEGLFLSNEDDARFIETDVAADALVGAFEQAIRQYFSLYPG